MVQDLLHLAHAHIICPSHIIHGGAEWLHCKSTAQNVNIVSLLKGDFQGLAHVYAMT